MAEMTLSFILREIGSALDQLLVLAERKAEVVVAGDTASLDEIVRSEEEISRALMSLEKERARLVEAGGADDPAIEDLRGVLRQKAERLTTLNERNQRLLKLGLEMVEFELKLFMPQPSYSGAHTKGPVLFDHRV